eukprot:RCo036416
MSSRGAKRKPASSGTSGNGPQAEVHPSGSTPPWPKGHPPPSSLPPPLPEGGAKEAEAPPPAPAAVSEEVESRAGVRQLRGLLRRTVRVEITDGRNFVGALWCVDPQRNVILREVTEHACRGPREDPASWESLRMLPMVLVPGAHIVRFEVLSGSAPAWPPAQPTQNPACSAATTPAAPPPPPAEEK